MTNKSGLTLLIFVFLCTSFLHVSAQYDVKTEGARGDGKTLETIAIQSAIDKAFMAGGGVVNITPGTYLTGTLILKDNVTLHLQAGAVLLGSPDYRDYTEIIQNFESRTNGLYTKYFMIFAEGVKNISITGRGTINGNGLKNFLNRDPQNLRPFMIRLVNCQDVTIRDVNLLESANWTLHLLGCSNVNVDGVKFESGQRSNRDGLDIDCCRSVTVSNSRFSTGDDAIVMKATSDVLCQDITITNCIITTQASGIKTGTESNGGFRNITVSNCIIRDLPRHTGIDLAAVDGGMLQNVMISNIVMENVATPFFIRLGIRSRPYKPGQYVNKIDDVKDITLSNISVLNAQRPSSIMGLHNHKIKNVTVSNYTVRNSDMEEALPYNKIPFEEFSYPMAIMFENLPAYGLYCRNVEKLHLNNLTMSPVNNETRPALVFDRVNGLELFSVKAEIPDPASPLAHLRNVMNVTAKYCSTEGMNNPLFEVEKNTSYDLHVSDNILQSGQKDMVNVPALPDEQIFEDFKTDLKYTVNAGDTLKGLVYHDLKLSPLDFNIIINKKGSLQMCLLILNSSHEPAKVLVKYEGITQEFTVNWDEWGWAPVALLKEYPEDRNVNFEIAAEDQNKDLKISKVYFRYQDVGKTD